MQYRSQKSSLFPSLDQVHCHLRYVIFKLFFLFFIDEVLDARLGSIEHLVSDRGRDCFIRRIVQRFLHVCEAKAK